jgi:hypothetical protein
VVSLEQLKTDNGRHDFGKTGHFPLLFFPYSYKLVTIFIVDAPVGGSDI